jgi:hypothetical protein
MVIKATTTGYLYAAYANDGGTFYVGRDDSTGGIFGKTYCNILWGDSAYATVFATNNTERMRIDSSGSLLAGTSTSPVTGGFDRSIALFKQLNDTSAYSGIQLEANGNTNVLGIGYNGSTFNFSQSYRTTGSFVPLSFSTSGTERMRIDTNGNVGIGTSSPIAKLDVGGGITDSVPATYGGTIRVNSSTQTTVQAVGGIEFPVAGDGYGYKMQQISNNGANLAFASRYGSASWTERMRIDSLGIVTMSAYGAGAATFSAAGVISSVSDETWKTKDGVPTNPDVMLQKLEPGYWFYNEEKALTFGEERQLGFYAQNVHEAIGEEAAPTPKEGKPWGYYDRSVLSVVVMSLKNALNTIEELKQRIATLENK